MDEELPPLTQAARRARREAEHRSAESPDAAVGAGTPPEERADAAEPPAPVGSAAPVRPVAPELTADIPVSAGSTSAASGSAETGRARNTAIFSLLTGFSRVAGLIREVLSGALYGTSGAASAFTLAFQIPNLLRSLFADAALSAAFVPVFSDLLQQGRRKDAMKLAANLSWVMLASLTALTALCILLSPLVVPLFAGKLDAGETQLAVHLTQLMFPVVVLLGINGLLVGMLNAEDHFSVPAFSPVVWNVAIMVFMIAGHVVLDGDAELYGYALGVLVGTVAQLWMAVPLVRRAGFRLGRPNLRPSPQVRQVLLLMLPVALGLGLVNFNLLVNSILGARIDDGAPRAIDAAFRLYMLPQGIFSVAIATVLFPALSRAAARSDIADLRQILGQGMRQIIVLLVPAAVITLVLAGVLIQVVYERGEFNARSSQQTAEALLVFSLTLPLNGLNLLLTRTFFALKQPWTTTWLAVISLVVNVVVSLALYRPLGIAGIVLGTVAANVAVVGSQLVVLRGRLHGSLGLGHTLSVALRVGLGALLLGLVVLLLELLVRALLGSSFGAALVVLLVCAPVGGLVYLLALRILGVQEAAMVERMIRSRLGGASARG